MQKHARVKSEHFRLAAEILIHPICNESFPSSDAFDGDLMQYLL